MSTAEPSLMATSLISKRSKWVKCLLLVSVLSQYLYKPLPIKPGWHDKTKECTNPCRQGEKAISLVINLILNCDSQNIGFINSIL